MRISDWSSDVCSSDLSGRLTTPWMRCRVVCGLCETMLTLRPTSAFINELLPTLGRPTMEMRPLCTKDPRLLRSEEHTSELQSLMRISYAGFCLKKQKNQITQDHDDYLCTQNHNYSP